MTPGRHGRDSKLADACLLPKYSATDTNIDGRCDVMMILRGILHLQFEHEKFPIWLCIQRGAISVLKMYEWILTRLEHGYRASYDFIILQNKFNYLITVKFRSSYLLRNH